MDTENRQGRPVDVEDLLLRTDWNSVEHCCPNVAPATPVILRRLLDGDASVQGADDRVAEACSGRINRDNISGALTFSWNE